MSSPANPSAAAANSPAASSRGLLSAVYDIISFFLQTGIRLWVRVTGKRINKMDEPWLSCPLGESGHIGTGIYERIAEQHGLRLQAPADAGLIPDFNALRGSQFDPDAVRSEIRHFYEHAAQYRLEVWSEVSLVGRFFLWLLVEFLSRRMDQLNFPLSSLEVAKGMTSEVVQLVEPASGQVACTGWLRRLKSSGRVIYAGLYSTTAMPGESNPGVKVTFPVPLGSSNVYLRPVAHPDGSFGLVSSGSAFGLTGFYRLVFSGSDHWRVRHVRSLRELFHVYLDAEGVLRTDHTVFFLGMSILRLHYKIFRAPGPHTKDSN
jgi:hypothetical protein